MSDIELWLESAKTLCHQFAPFVVLALTSFAAVTACGQAPEVVLHKSSSVIPQSVVFSIRPYSSGWVLLQASSDFANWQPVVNLLTTNTTVPFVDFTGSNSLVRFYRVRSPGVTAGQALSAWQASRPTHYQYSFQNSKLDAEGVVLAGTVTISNGIKTVTNATANGFPTSTFDPADFLTPEEVLALIADVEMQGANLAHVTYDAQRSFPAAVVISWSTLSIADYRILELLDLSAEADAGELPWASSVASGEPDCTGR